MNTLKIALLSALLVTSAAFGASAKDESTWHVPSPGASYQAPENNNNVSTASYAAPENNNNVSTASYQAPEAGNTSSSASYNAPENNNNVVTAALDIKGNDNVAAA